MIVGSHPLLTCEAARDFEAARFAGDEEREWPAMLQAGRAVASAVVRDFREIGGWPRAARLLVLAGKGHNAGDALLAARYLLAVDPAAQVEVVFALGERRLRPLAARAWRELVQAGRARVAAVPAPGGSYDLVLDGIFGFQFRPPLEERVARLLDAANACPVRLRAAVDLPSAGRFQADFTYATGILKTPVLGEFWPQAGRVRYLDLGFFRGDEPGTERVLTPAVLAPLARGRPRDVDKRTFGHVLVLGGSRLYPGAVLMTVRAALRSGAGLVTAFVPESLVAAFAAQAPEAMWVGWPETPAGGLALEGQHLLTAALARASALVVGPGIGREAETQALVRAVASTTLVPIVLDADALQADVVAAVRAPCVLTPHAGEWLRIAATAPATAVVVRKGPVTRISADGVIYHSLYGGPVLARGGSGDLLAGLVGGLLAQAPQDPAMAAVRGVVWHGRAADALARAHGQVAIVATQLLDFLPTALRESEDEH